MKKLSKINISAEKVLGNDELVNLRGGNTGGCSCTCFSTEPPFNCKGYVFALDGNCVKECGDLYPGFTGVCGNIECPNIH